MREHVYPRSEHRVAETGRRGKKRKKGDRGSGGRKEEEKRDNYEKTGSSRAFDRPNQFSE